MGNHIWDLREKLTLWWRCQVVIGTLETWGFGGNIIGIPSWILQHFSILLGATWHTLWKIQHSYETWSIRRGWLVIYSLFYLSKEAIIFRWLRLNNKNHVLYSDPWNRCFNATSINPRKNLDKFCQNLTVTSRRCYGFFYGATEGLGQWMSPFIWM